MLHSANRQYWPILSNTMLDSPIPVFERSQVKPLLSQIVRLTKSILLCPLDPQKRPSAQFIAGKHAPFGFPNGIGITWWYSDDTFHAIDAVVTLLTQESPDFRDCDPESVSDVVTKTLQEICVDKTVFNVDMLFFGHNNTLFDCRAASVAHFAEAIQKAMEINLRLLICGRCTLYTVPRFKVTSFLLENESIHVISKSDRIAWQLLVDKGYEFNGWTPEVPNVGSREDRTFAPPADFECVLIAEEHGTQKGSRFSSILRFRKLIAVLFSIASQRAAYPYHKAMARPSEFCMQFPHKSGLASTISRTDCGALVPYFTSDIQIGPDEVTAIQNWYEACVTCNQDVQRRIEKGAHFLNRAMNSDDIEAYVNYFVTLDALFGQRGSVESSILAGVQALGIGPELEEKTPWLFDLRNEIVHGGSRYINEWPKYTRYTQHFRTKPDADIRTLAQLAVLNAPRVLTP